MEKISIRATRHLGDVLTVLNLMYSRSLENGWEISIKGPEFIKQLFKIFDYKGLIYEGVPEYDIGQDSILFDYLPKFNNGHLSKRKPTVKFLADDHFLFNKKIKAKKITKVHLPDLKLPEQPKENIVCFQFDNRTSHETKIVLNPEEQKIVLARTVKLKRPVGIGGHETKPYSNHEFRLGTIFHSMRNLLACEKFVGSDSGMSHLAGTAKVKGEIIIIHPVEPHPTELIQMYEIMYPTLKCYRRHELLGREMIL